MKKFFFILRKISLITVIFIFFISILIIIFDLFILTPDFTEAQIKSFFLKNYNRKLNLNIKKISLFSGLEINNLILYNNSEWKRKVFIKIDKLKIKYNLPAILLKKLIVNEISIINPSINIEFSEKKQKWNFSYLLQPNTAPKENRKKNSSPLNISIYLNKFLLKNLSFEMINKNYLKIQGLNLYNKFHINKTSIDGIDYFILSFYPSKTKNIIVKQENSSMIMPLNLFIKININRKKTKSNILISYQLKNQIFELNNRFVKSPDIKFNLNAFLNPLKKSLCVNSLTLFINNNPFLNIKADFFNIDSNPYFFINTKKNYLNFKSLSYLMQFFLNDHKLKIRGKFFTSDLKISKKKNSNFLNFLGKFNINNFYLKYPTKNINVNNFNTSIEFKNKKIKNIFGKVYSTADSIIMPNINMKNFNIKITAFLKNNNLNSLHMTTKDSLINNGILNISLELDKNKNIFGTINLKNLILSSINKQIHGSLSLKNTLSGNLNKSITTSLETSVPQLQFNYIKDNTDNFSKKINFNLFTSIKIYPSDKNIFINKFIISLNNLFYLNMAAKILNNAKYIQAYSKKSFIDLNNIAAVLPIPLKASVPYNDIESQISNSIRFYKKDNLIKLSFIITNSYSKLYSDTSGIKINGFVSKLRLTKKNKNIRLKYNFTTGSVVNRFTEYSTNYANGFKIFSKKLISSAELKADIINNADTTIIKNISLNIPDIPVYGHITGSLIKNDIQVKTVFKFTPKTNIIFMTNIFVNGGIDVKTFVNTFKNDILIKGNLNFNHFNLSMKNLKITDINGFIPYTHIISSSGNPGADVLKESAIKNLETINYPLIRLYRNKPDNLTIKSVTVNGINIKDIKLDMNYERNIARINKADFSLLDGSITINKSYFDLADLQPQHFNYQFNMELTGINPVKIKKIKLSKKDDTRLFANMRVRGTGIDFVKSSDFYASVNITHIGSKLASKFLEALDPEGKDTKIKTVRDALEKGAKPELLSLKVQYGLLYSKIWIEESNLYKYVLFMIPRLPPSPISFDRKSIEEIMSGMGIGDGAKLY